MTISNKSHPWATKTEEPAEKKPTVPKLVVLTYYTNGLQKRIALVMDDWMMKAPGWYQNVLNWLAYKSGKRMASVEITCAIQGVSYDVFDDDMFDAVLQLASAHGLPALQLTMSSTGEGDGWGTNGNSYWG